METIDRSSMVTCTHRCQRGHHTTVPLWVVIDADARPDLHEIVIERARTMIRCERCGRSDERDEPLVVLRRSHGTLIGLLIPGRQGLSQDEPEWITDLDWNAWPEGAPLLVPASHDAAAVAVTRSLASDLIDGAEGLAAVHAQFGTQSAAAYGELLTTIHNIQSSNERMALIGEAVSAASSDDFCEMLERYPELLTDATLELLDNAYGTDPDVRLDLGRQMLREARSDPAQAWIAHRKRLTKVGESLVSDALKWIEQLGEAESDPDRLIEVATGALEYATHVAAEEEFVAVVLEARAAGHMRSHKGRRDEHLRAALSDYRSVLALTSSEHPERAGRLLNVAVAVGQQVEGDVRAHARMARRMLEQALDFVDEAADPRLAAMIRTNLAQVLLLQARDEDLPLLREARSLCELALVYRSPDRDAEDWSYTMVNLGAAIGRLASAGEADLVDAQAAYNAVVRYETKVSAEVVSHARLNLLIMAFDELDTDGDSDTGESDLRLARVERLAQDVLGANDAAPVTRGRALWRLGAVRRLRNEFKGARTALEEAVGLLEGSHLVDFQQAAWDLGVLLSDAAEWSEAAVFYRKALRAVEALVSGPWESADRVERVAAANRLSRWAAFTFVMIGAFEEAVLALENGRTRELRRQLQMEDPGLSELERLMPQAVTRWRDASSALIEGVGDVDVAGEALEGALTRIRSVPGFEGFARGMDMKSVRAAASTCCPIVYVNPTPSGTALLRVDVSGEIESCVLQVTSRDIVWRVLFGTDASVAEVLEIDADAAELPDGAVSYTLAAAGRGDDMDDGQELPQIGDALDALLPWIGERVCAAVDELLRRHGDGGALLVVCGPLATVPLAAASFGDHGRCLLDDFTISVTPSASAHAAALRRAKTRSDVFDRLVSVADPTNDLRFTRTEVAQIATHFADARVADGVSATCAWVRRHAAEASVLHLACHGYGGMIDATESGFVLADEHLTGREVARLGPLRARLAVASACQSGVTEISDLADEAFSLGAAFLAAGSACAIASLWSVNDLATAMLMTRLYEEIAAGLTPPAALASAQRWLRDLDDAEQEAFLDRHAVLAAERERACRANRWPVRQHNQSGRFSHPRYWAAFVVLGA